MEDLPPEITINLFPVLPAETLVRMYPIFKDVLESPYMLETMCKRNNLPLCQTLAEYICLMSSASSCSGVINSILNAISSEDTQLFSQLAQRIVSFPEKVVMSMGRKHPLFYKWVPPRMRDVYTIATMSSGVNVDWWPYVEHYSDKLACESARINNVNILSRLPLSYGFEDALDIALELGNKEASYYLMNRISKQYILEHLFKCSNPSVIDIIDKITLNNIDKLFVSSKVSNYFVAKHLDNVYGLISWDVVASKPHKDVELLKHAILSCRSIGRYELNELLMECGRLGYVSSFMFLHNYMNLSPVTTERIIRKLVIKEAGIYTAVHIWLQLEISLYSRR